MKITRRSLAAATTALVLSLGLVSCGGGGGDAAADKARTLHIGNGAEPLSLDPHQASGTWENRIIGEMLQGLTTEDPQGRPIPGMATEWSTSPDGLVWTFKLRDAKWSDGQPVTADDFVFAWQRIMTTTPPAKYASILYVIKNAEKIYDGRIKDVNQLGVRAIDAKTLEVTLEHPAPYLPGLLTHYTSFPIPKHVVEKVGKDWIKAENFVGNGPYKLQQWKPNDFVHLVRNTNFYDNANVCLDQLFFYPTPDDNAAERKVRTGDLDINTNFSGSRLEEINKNLPGYARIHGYTGLTYYIFNMRKAPFNDARVRAAISMTADREFITKEILKAGQQPAYSLVPPGIADYQTGAMTTDFKGQSMETRLARAKKLLEEAGYGPNKPLKFTFSFRNSGDNPRVAPVVQQNWAKIAPWVQVEILGAETQINYEKLRTGDFELGDAGWISDFNDAKNFVYLFQTSTDQLNYGKYSNPEFDRLMDAADVEKDTQKRAALMKQAEAIVLKEHGFMPMWFLTNRNLVSPRVTGWVDNAVDIHRARYLCTTDAQKAGAAPKS
ncbi:peptide ABC transporter substrate-binding protein [Aquidulcibacter sp.]|uniref:peptide ABC transporter substrate-binding protein n=1 Tax=Aquidulcibacter sp. TaxID=2052990 RepID=UPI0025C545DE|nr:peptide ABC transporter substrate-binding protein [Aquidulcibacter sp.]MCA3693837.1 peptide ABC transporter substrate-binding protein [Aquidulcibacter sp.]